MFLQILSCFFGFVPVAFWITINSTHFFPDSLKKKPFFPLPGTAYVSSSEESSTCSGSTGCLLDMPFSQLSTVLQEQFPQEMLAPYRAVFMSFLQGFPLDPGRALTSRQASCFPSHHCPLKGPQNKLRANEADAIHQNLIKILLYK